MNPIVRDRITPSLLTRIRKIPAYMMDRKVSLFKKAGIVLGLIYIVSPIDAIPDVIPVVGWLDDVGVLAIMYGFMMRELSEYVTGLQQIEAIETAEVVVVKD